MARVRFSILALVVATAGCGREVVVWEREPFGRDPPQVGSLVGRLLTSNNGDDTLSVLDPERPAPAARLPVGMNPVELEGPHHVAVDAAGRYVYVNLSLAVKGSGSGPHGAHGAGTLPGFVLKLEAATGRAVAWVEVDPNPGDSVLSADGRRLYVTHYDLVRWIHAIQAGEARHGDSNLVVIDTERMVVEAKVPLCPAAHGVRLGADGGKVYATCGSDQIAVVDLRGGAGGAPEVRRVLLPGAEERASCQRCPFALGVAPDGLVWVASLGPGGGASGRGTLTVFDPRLGAGGGFDPGRTRSFRGSPVFPAFVAMADGYRVLVPEQGAAGDALHVLAPGRAGEPPQEIEVLPLERARCQMAHQILTAADGRRGWLVCEGDHVGPGSLVWLSLEPLAVLGSAATGVFPDGVALVPAAGP